MLARAAVFLVVASAWCVDGQMGPRWIVPAQKAMQAQSEGRWSDAAAHYAVCLESGVPADKEVAVRTNLGLSLHNTGKYEEAIAAYDAVLALQPTYADCHHNKGNSLYKARRHAEAVEVSFFLTLIHFPHMPHPIFPIYHKHLFLRCVFLSLTHFPHMSHPISPVYHKHLFLRCSFLSLTHFPHMSHPIFPIYHKHSFCRGVRCGDRDQAWGCGVALQPRERVRADGAPCLSRRRLQPQRAA